MLGNAGHRVPPCSSSLLSGRLSLLRRVLTPTVSGTVIMLIAVTVMPYRLRHDRGEAPEGASSLATPLTALSVTILLIIVAIALQGQRRAAPVGAVDRRRGGIGSLVAGFYRPLQHRNVVAEAGWIGLPQGDWPGLNLELRPGRSGACCRPSSSPPWWAPSRPSATGSGDSARVLAQTRARRTFRAVQGAVAADGTSATCCPGLAGTVPNTTYSSSVSVTELTGVAARRVGIAVGADVSWRSALLPKAAGADPGHTRTGGGGLRHRAHGDAVHGRASNW